MDKEKHKEHFNHQDERLKINTSFEEAIKVLVQEKPKENKEKNNKKK